VSIDSLGFFVYVAGLLLRIDPIKKACLIFTRQAKNQVGNIL